MSGIRDPGLRRFLRREYLRNHAQARRAADKSEGARRIDVTLHGAALADYATVRRHIEGFERLAQERNISWTPRRRPISDTEVIHHALSWAAARMREDDEDAAAEGIVQILAD
jgi:hypothetical protein